MTHILLYWNHICVLHRQEKAFLDGLTQKLLSDGIQLEVRYFGLGYPEHMSEYLARPDAVLPDLIVSADLEVFEDPDIFCKLKDDLFLSIPLVYYTREPEVCGHTALADWNGLAFGGINNSAVKTVVKAVWERWGHQAAEALLERSLVTDMPIGAFQAVRQGQASTALVPSQYALRADGQETFLQIPREGPVLIPSYFCARTSVPQSFACRMVKEILCQELCSFYAANGDLIVYPEHAQGKSQQESPSACCPSTEWLASLTHDEFYGLYCQKLLKAADWKTGNNLHV